MRVKGTDIYLTRGDTAFITLEIELDTDFTIDKLYFTVKQNTRTTQKIFQKCWSSGGGSECEGISEAAEQPLDPNFRVFQVEIKSEDTNNADFGLYRYDVQMHYTDSNIQGYEGLVTLVKPSIFGIQEEVTLEGWN